MDNLNIFIIGFLSAIIGVPVIQSLIDLIYVWFEAAKMIPSKLITKANKEILETQSDESELNETSAIGFQYPTEDYDE